MSRSGYTDDCYDMWELIRWRGAVKSSIRGKRGQAFLRELLDALDDMPEKRLIAHSFGEAGAYCTLGAIGAKRGVTMPKVSTDWRGAADDEFDPEDSDGIREAARTALGIPDALAAEIMFENDEGGWNETPEARWQRMRAWAAKRIKEPQL